MGVKDVFLSWPVVRQLTGEDPLGRGAAAQSGRTAAGSSTTVGGPGGQG